MQEIWGSTIHPALNTIICPSSVDSQLCLTPFLLPFEPASLGSRTVWPCHFISWTPCMLLRLILWVRFTHFLQVFINSYTQLSGSNFQENLDDKLHRNVSSNVVEGKSADGVWDTSILLFVEFRFSARSWCCNMSKCSGKRLSSSSQVGTNGYLFTWSSIKNWCALTASLLLWI